MSVRPESLSSSETPRGQTLQQMLLFQLPKTMFCLFREQKVVQLSVEITPQSQVSVPWGAPGVPPEP